MTLLSITGDELRDIFRPGMSRIQAVYQCDACTLVNLAIVEASSDEVRYSQSAEIVEEASDVLWLPSSAVGKGFPDVPPHIAEPATEAYACWSVGANRAAILMARSVIEAAAKDHDITKGRLWEKIDSLLAGKIIDELTHEAATEVRHYGNDMAHGDFGEQVTSEAAEALLRFMGMVLSDAYQKRAEIRRIRDARKAKTTTVKATDATTPSSS